MTDPIIAPPGSIEAAYALGREIGRESSAPSLIGDPLPRLPAEFLRSCYGDVTESLAAAYRDGHHAGRMERGR